ncbi:uncharacterized protein LOC127871366 [Dreissena polymorpha]|uniref:Uncharacterized protein n=1 Tax=Dreissena polymorpha TaxID=45954 RepID=A0A9D4R8K6_DREPO|nr:uncharacterized protein LOC127871366 [Dreissena polymorpha]XP_052270145.1 uncharacterized protein LOC127871366 [Dreissena polymorpha]KAH3857265.1 hypothetical protein DPMN_099871 [Dreissena polymorpha]
MGARVQPYFILTAEKVTNPRDLETLQPIKPIKIGYLGDQINPLTPPPSGVSGSELGILALDENLVEKKKNKKKKKVKYTISVREIRKKSPLNKKLASIKEKLEKSRERINGQRAKLSDIDLKCEPVNTSKADMSYDQATFPFRMDRSVSDMGPSSLAKSRNANLGSSPFVYFVVSEERIKDADFVLEDGDRVVSKSADKRRRVRLVEENRLKRDRKEKLSQSAKFRGLAREVGLNNNQGGPKPSEESPTVKGGPKELVFPGPDYESTRPTTTTAYRKGTRLIRSPPKIPPGTPATTHGSHSDVPLEINGFDVDDTVPRKPFLSRPMYNGKSRGIQALSQSNFELPTISADQRRRNLGLGTRFEEFAYPKPSSEQRQRKVSFAEQLPVIRGSGFVLNSADLRHDPEIPSLGPRANTMGTITLPSENVDKQAVCQRFVAGENMTGSRQNRKFGIPLPIAKIDIVSNLYDEMIIKMIQEYLQDSNTPSRQSQLARELLVHLQKHNEHMKELNVPNLDKNKIKKSELVKHKNKAQRLLNDINFPAPPNTAEESAPKGLNSPSKENGLPS